MLDAATAAAYNSDPAVKAYLDAMAKLNSGAAAAPAAPAATAAPKPATAPNPLVFEGAGPTPLLTPGQVAAAEWRRRYLSNGQSDPNAPTIAQVYANAAKALQEGKTITDQDMSAVNFVPQGGEAVSGGVFGGSTRTKAFTHAGTGRTTFQPEQTRGSPASIGSTGYVNPNVAQFIARRPEDYGGGGYPGGTTGLLQRGGATPGTQVPTAAQIAAQPTVPSGATGGSGAASGGSPAPGAPTAPQPPQVTTPPPPGSATAPTTGGSTYTPTQPVVPGAPPSLPVQAPGATTPANRQLIVQNPEMTGFDPRTMTVEGRLQGLLSNENVLVQQARTKAQQEAAERGLNNSSMAIQAGEQAAFASMLPIADADAKLMYDKARTQYNVGAQAVLADQTFGFNKALAEQGYGHDLGKINAQGNINMQLQTLVNNNELTKLERQFAYDMSKFNAEIAYRTQEQIRGLDANAQLAYAKAQESVAERISAEIQAIYQNPEMKPADREIAIQNVYARWQQNSAFVEQIYGVAKPGEPGSISNTNVFAAAQQTEANFDAAAYLAAHPDVADPNKWSPNNTPYQHWLMYGRAQGYAFPAKTA